MELNLSNQEKITIIFLILVIVLTFGVILYKNINNNEKFVITSATSRASESSEGSSVTKIEEPPIIIHIAGAVKNPGVYKLKATNRVIDAVKIAGGETENADLDAINLAALLKDGQRIVIPYRNLNISEGEEDYIGFNPVNRSFLTSSDKININAANSNLLQTLPGIGPVLADRIVEYRNKNGYFSSIEDLKNVTGIGEKKFEGIKDLICVQ